MTCHSKDDLHTISRMCSEDLVELHHKLRERGMCKNCVAYHMLLSLSLMMRHTGMSPKMLTDIFASTSSLAYREDGILIVADDMKPIH